MTNFDFGITVGTNLNKFVGNQIYDVKFDGCEARDFDSVQNPNQKFKVLDIKFSNSNGYFTDTIWEPNDQDEQDIPGMYGNMPSHKKTMMLKLKHLLNTVNPEIAAKINSGEQKLSISSWDALRQFMIKATTPGIGKKTKIKLVNNKKGEPIFPAYSTYNRNGLPVLTTNFIGDDVFWTSKELNKINQAATAKPTSTANLEQLNSSTEETSKTNVIDDFNFNDI